jgi:hypothetical protein
VGVSFSHTCGCSLAGILFLPGSRDLTFTRSSVMVGEKRPWDQWMVRSWDGGLTAAVFLFLSRTLPLGFL